MEIESRFGVSGDRGAAHGIVGDCTLGIGGGGFLYTNTESLSVGVVLRLDDLLRSGRTATEVFEHFTQHPGMRQYLRDGELVEYGSHLVAEGGYRMVGEVAMNGMLVAGEAAGLAINSGLTVRGMDLAVGSAVAAADAIAEAVASGDEWLPVAGLPGVPHWVKVGTSDTSSASVVPIGSLRFANGT